MILKRLHFCLVAIFVFSFPFAQLEAKPNFFQWLRIQFDPKVKGTHESVARIFRAIDKTLYAYDQAYQDQITYRRVKNQYESLIRQKNHFYSIERTSKSSEIIERSQNNVAVINQHLENLRLKYPATLRVLENPEGMDFIFSEAKTSFSQKLKAVLVGKTKEQARDICTQLAYTENWSRTGPFAKEVSRIASYSIDGFKQNFEIFQAHLRWSAILSLIELKEYSAVLPYLADETQLSPRKTIALELLNRLTFINDPELLSAIDRHREYAASFGEKMPDVIQTMNASLIQWSKNRTAMKVGYAQLTTGDQLIQLSDAARVKFDPDKIKKVAVVHFMEGIDIHIPDTPEARFELAMTAHELRFPNLIDQMLRMKPHRYETLNYTVWTYTTENIKSPMMNEFVLTGQKIELLDISSRRPSAGVRNNLEYFSSLPENAAKMEKLVSRPRSIKEQKAYEERLRELPPELRVIEVIRSLQVETLKENVIESVRK